jgi:hypothetical protein
MDCIHSRKCSTPQQQQKKHSYLVVRDDELGQRVNKSLIQIFLLSAWVCAWAAVHLTFPSPIRVNQWFRFCGCNLDVTFVTFLNPFIKMEFEQVRSQ